MADYDRLVEQARELSARTRKGPRAGGVDLKATNRLLDDGPDLLAGLADAVEQQQTECVEWRATVDMMGTAFLPDLGTDPESYERFKDSVEFWRLRANNLDRLMRAVERDRDQARARVATVEAEVFRLVDGIREALERRREGKEVGSTLRRALRDVAGDDRGGGQ